MTPYTDDDLRDLCQMAGAVRYGNRMADALRAFIAEQAALATPRGTDRINLFRLRLKLGLEAAASDRALAEDADHLADILPSSEVADVVGRAA